MDDTGATGRGENVVSWMLVIVAALVLANVAVAVRSSGRAPARSRSDDDLRQAVASQRARESNRRD